MITRKKVKVRVRIISEVSDLKRKKIAYRIFIEERKNAQREDFVITWWIWDLEKMVFSVFFRIKIVVSFCDEERIRFFLFFFIFFAYGVPTTMVSIVFGFVFSSVFFLLSFLGLCVRWHACVVSEPFDLAGWEGACWSERSVYALFFPGESSVIFNLIAFFYAWEFIIN